MAYLSGLSVGKKQNAGIAAVTGFGQGVLRGIETAEHIKAQRARTAVMQQEMMLRKKALEYGIEQDKQVQDWSRSLGEYQAWRAGSGDEIEQQGPPSPEQNVDPSFVGPQPQAAGNLGRSQNLPAIDAKLAELARTIPDAKTRDAFLETVREEEKARSATKARDSLLEEIKNRRLQKGYRSTTIDGAEDVAGEEMAMSFEDQLAQLDPANDPDGTAEIADKIRSDDRNFRIDSAKNNVLIGRRMKTETDLDAQIQAREAVPGYDSSEARTLQALWKQHLITDAQLGQMLPDALNGTLALKANLAQLQRQVAELTLEKMRAQIESEKARPAKTEAETDAAKALAEQRRASAGLSDARASGKLVLPGRNGAARAPLADEKDIGSILKQRFPDGRTEDNAAEYDKERARLESKAKGPDSPDSLKADILGKKITKRDAEERARALGLTPEQLRSLLGSK